MALGMPIGKTAEQTGLTVDTIRFYQKIGIIPRPARSPAGYRLFDSAEIRQLEFIGKAQKLGFSLNEIKELLILRRDHVHACSRVRGLLQQKLSDVGEKVAKLTLLEQELKKALRKCNRDLRSDNGTSHDDYCPVLQTLEEKNGNKRTGRRSVARGEGKKK